MNDIDEYKNIHIVFQIDTNRINAKQDRIYMNQLENWHNDEIIFIEMSRVAQEEILRENRKSIYSITRKKKVYCYTFSETCADTQEETFMLKTIENILFPLGAKNISENNDVEIVFNAWKYGCILITDDGDSKRQPGGILGNKKKLKEIGITVMRDYEAVDYVRNKIKYRY